ncbi:Rieske 2Fe-2S domain-containing protein [Brevundimonas vesicularis]|uniref:aromatic ring-hydroxylating dioxygenase subunit alpha n=1 Tax=Brevundimonas vesicularis TaxID=41276 RepID=UPI0038D4420E
MLINNWYVAAVSSDIVQGKPFGVRMLGFDFVLYRRSDGSVACLSDVCIHRGASLSRGQCVDDNVACPFHGWQFTAEGKCDKIPSMGDDAVIPRRTKIDSYPTVEQYDLVWVFLGDLPEELRPPVPSLLPEYHQTDSWRTTRMVFEANANWQKFEENSLDTAHLSFVHSTFGNRISPKAVHAPLVRTAYGTKVQRERAAPKASQKSGILGQLLSEEREKTSVELEYSVVGICHRINPTFRPGMSQVTFSASTPIDPYNTRQFGLQARNYAIEPEHDQERLDGRLNAITEDINVISHVRPKIGPTSFREEALVKSDEMESTFRHMVFRMIEAGWEIDYDKVKAEWDRKIYVIPSPARREDPTGWVHASVPLTGERKDDFWLCLAEESGQPMNEGASS